ncbi:MAG: WGR domain-containing protein [gamma proteobacterium symbiont of Phacoides pectinatus]
MRIYMQTPHSPENPLRFYQLHLQQDLLGHWTLIRESGLQGSRGSVKRNVYDTREEAEQAMERLRDMQLHRGYKVMFREGSPQDEC